jgi:uncharacterized protein YegL
MRGDRIYAVNAAVRATLQNLKSAQNNAGEFSIELLLFSSQAKWMTDQPKSVSEYQFADISDVSGGTNYSKAFQALNERFGSYPDMTIPLIVFITDGEPSDMGLYREELDILERNSTYNKAISFGFAIGEGATSSECLRVLGEITRNFSRVHSIPNTVDLVKEMSETLQSILNLPSDENDHSTSTNNQSADRQRHSHSDDHVANQSGSQTRAKDLPDAVQSGDSWIYELVL